MSDALLYELLTTKSEARRQCFAKFPEGPNPVDLINHAGVLMRHEIETGTPSGPPSKCIEDIQFIFNKALTGEIYIPPINAQAAIEKETTRLAASIESFVEKSGHIESFFPDLLKGSQSERIVAHMDAERAIVLPGALLPFLSQLEAPTGGTPLPPIDIIDGKWALYRWLQVELLFALDVYVRYQGMVPSMLSPNMYEKMEHDVLDAEQLVLGCLEGAFATHEKKLKRWWSLLCPEGCLFDESANKSLQRTGHE